MYSFDPVSGLNVPFTATWFKAPHGAHRFTRRHSYGSYNWQKPIPYPDQVGEVIGAPRPWSNGKTPPGLLGANHCGTDDQWVGKLTRLTVPIPDNVYSQPSCCIAPSGTPCPLCAGGIAPITRTVVASGGTVSFAPCNGTWTVVNPGGCLWQTSTDPGFIIAEDNPTLWHMFAFNGSNSAKYIISTVDWDCWNTGTPNWQLESVVGTGTPPTVRVL